MPYHAHIDRLEGERECLPDHTQVIWLGFTPSPDGSTTEPRTEEPQLVYVKTLLTEDGSEFHMETYPSQDSMAWVTQGAIANRAGEHLGAGDAGIVMWRQLLDEQIAIVEAGDDPINVFREQHDIIEFSPARAKVGGRYVRRDSGAARSWREYLPGSREASLAGVNGAMSDDKRAQAAAQGDRYSSDRRTRPGALVAP